MKFQKTLAVLSFMAIATAFSFAQAGPGERRGHRDPDQKMERALNNLDLTKEQKEEIGKIREQYKEKLKALREDSRNKRKAFKESMDSSKENAELRKAHEAMMKAQRSVQSEQFEMALAIRSELTKEQREKMGKMRGERFKRMKEGFKGRRGERKGPPDDSSPEKE